MEKKLVTIFTPAYNRAYIIGSLYHSLLNQTNPDFEWLIVDDGSTDNTRKLVDSFIQEARISILNFYSYLILLPAFIFIFKQNLLNRMLYVLGLGGYLTVFLIRFVYITI